MEDDVVVVASLSKGREILACFWGVVVVELDDNSPLQDVSRFSQPAHVVVSHHCRFENNICGHLSYLSRELP